MREFYAYEWLPYAISIGIQEQQFWQMTMRQYNAHLEAENLRQCRQDQYAWSQGQYFYIAMMAAIDHNKVQYPEEPFTANYGLSEDEIADKEMQKELNKMNMWIIQEKINGLQEL